MAASVLVIDDDPWMAEAIRPVLVQNGHRLDYARLTEIDICQLQDHLPDIVVLRTGREYDDRLYCGQLAVLLEAPLFLLFDPDHAIVHVPEPDALGLPVTTLYLIEQAVHIRALLQALPYPPRQQAPFFFVDGELAVDMIRQEVWRSGDLVGLSPTEFRLLKAFAQNPGVLLKHATLLEEVWGPDHHRGPQALRPHIHSLRRKLEPDPTRPLRILTFPGEGYAFRRIQER